MRCGTRQSTALRRARQVHDLTIRRMSIPGPDGDRTEAVSLWQTPALSTRKQRSSETQNTVVGAARSLISVSK